MSRKKKATQIDFAEVSIPTLIFEKIKERIRGTEFTSVSQYVTFVLNEVLTEDEEKTESMTERDEKQIKERLKALGYID